MADSAFRVGPTPEPYELNYDWARREGAHDDAWYTLAVTVEPGTPRDQNDAPDALEPAARGIERFLAGWTAGFARVDGKLVTVGYEGGVLATVQDAGGDVPVVLLHSHGQDACDSITDAAAALRMRVLREDKAARFVYEERAPR